MQYTDLLKLISKEETFDDVGNIIEKENIRDVYAKTNVVGTREFYNAMAVGITPTAELQIKKMNYNDEDEVIYKNKRYSVIRTIPKGTHDVVLVLGVKQVNNG